MSSLRKAFCMYRDIIQASSFCLNQSKRVIRVASLISLYYLFLFFETKFLTRSVLYSELCWLLMGEERGGIGMLLVCLFKTMVDCWTNQTD